MVVVLLHKQNISEGGARGERGGDQQINCLKSKVCYNRKKPKLDYINGHTLKKRVGKMREIFFHQQILKIDKLKNDFIYGNNSNLTLYVQHWQF